MMDNHTIKIRLFAKIFSDAAFPITLHSNPKYCIGENESGTPYIAYDDVMGNRYVIRMLPAGRIPSYLDNEGNIVAEYPDMEMMVRDGWMLSDEGNHANFDGWIKWAEKNELDPTIISFLKDNPQYWYNTPTSSGK